jgi:hypothetical protein
MKKIQNVVEQKHGTKTENYDGCRSTTPGEMWDQNVLKMLDTNVFKMWDQNVFQMLGPECAQNVGPKCFPNVGPKMKNYIITFCSLSSVNFSVFKLWDQNAPNSIIPFHGRSPKPCQQGECHTMTLPFTLKSILMQKKNYGNSNIFHHAKI